MLLPVPQVVIPQEWERCLLESEVSHEKTPEHTIVRFLRRMYSTNVAW
jgi:hypothetical protein